MSAPCVRCERPVPDDLALCHSCTGGLAEALLTVPALVADLTITRAGLDRTAGARYGGRSAVVPLPIKDLTNERSGHGIRLPGEAALADLAVSLIGWARALAEDLDATPAWDTAYLVQLAVDQQHRHESGDQTNRRERCPGIDPAALTDTATGYAEQAAVWLAQHPALIRAHEAAPELAADLDRGIKRLLRTVDLGPTVFLGKCGTEHNDSTKCEAELWAEPDDAWVRCPAKACGTQHEIAALKARARDDAEDLLYTLADMLKILDELGAGVAKTTLYRWARERRITPRGYEHDRRITDHRVAPNDPGVYRIGDVLALSRREPKPTGKCRRNADMTRKNA